MTSLEYAGPNNNASGKRLGAAIVSQAEVASEIAFSWSSGLGWTQDWQRHQQGVQVQSGPEAVIPSALPVPLNNPSHQVMLLCDGPPDGFASRGALGLSNILSC